MLSPQLLQKRKTVLLFVVLDPGKGVGWSEFFSSSEPFIVSEELLIRSTSGPKTDGTQRTSQGSARRPMRLQRSGPTVSLQCNGLLLQTFSASPRLTLPPVLRSRKFAIALFMESGGAGF